MMVHRLYQATIGLLLLGGMVMAGKDRDDIINQRQELEQMQQQVEEGRARLDSLKNHELEIGRRISEFDQRISSNKKVIQRLNAELRALKHEASRTQQRLDDSRDQLDRQRRQYLGQIRQFYESTRRAREPYVDRPNYEIELNRRVIYLAAVAEHQSGNVVFANQLLEETVGELDDLSGREANIARLKQKKETSTSLERNKKRHQEKELTKVRRLETEQADLVLMLEQAAREMEAIITRLEEDRALRESARLETDAPSAFASLRGQLPSPCRGNIAVTFGSQVHPVTKLKSFSPGITIAGRKGRTVYAVASGTVAMVSNLRGYGNFVIINHDNRYYTTYAGLSDILVARDDYILGGSKIAAAGEDGLVKFELRKGREPLDPIKWIRIDAF